MKPKIQTRQDLSQLFRELQDQRKALEEQLKDTERELRLAERFVRVDGRLWPRPAELQGPVFKVRDREPLDDLECHMIWPTYRFLLHIGSAREGAGLAPYTLWHQALLSDEAQS